MPINAKANQNETPKNTDNYDLLGAISPGNTLYREAPDVTEALTLAQAQQIAKAQNHATGLAYSCVAFAKNYTGFGPQVWGDGGRYLPLTSIPTVGAVVVFTYTHVAVITNIQNGILTLSESNYVHGQITNNRQIPSGDATIAGFYQP